MIGRVYFPNVFGICLRGLPMQTSGTLGRWRASSGEGFQKLISHRRTSAAVMTAPKHNWHPHPTSLPSIAECRGLLAMTPMARIPLHPRSPFRHFTREAHFAGSAASESLPTTSRSVAKRPICSNPSSHRPTMTAPHTNSAAHQTSSPLAA